MRAAKGEAYVLLVNFRVTVCCVLASRGAGRRIRFALCLGLRERVVPD
jgi:hypothetical protein